MNKLAYGTEEAKEEEHLRMFSDACEGCFEIGSVFVFCEKKKLHKGKCCLKMDSLEIRWAKDNDRD